MKSSYRPIRALVAILMALMLAGTLAACAGSASAATLDQNCIQQLNPAQVTQAQQALDVQGQTNVSTNADGSQTVCVMDANYQPHYYNQNDGFSQFLLYSSLVRHVHPLLAYGMLSNQMSASDALFLSLVLPNMYDVDRYGGVYPPYSNSSGSWTRNRSHTTIQNVRITNVYYGTKNVSEPLGHKPPSSSYDTKATAMPKSNDKVANVSSVAKGALVVSAIKGAKASTYVNPSSSPSAGSTATSPSKVTPGTVKQAAPPATYNNPSANSANSGPAATTPSKVPAAVKQAPPAAPAAPRAPSTPRAPSAPRAPTVHISPPHH